jgi:hypothetical protein
MILFSACAGMQPEPARHLTLEETLRLAEEAGAGKKISDLSQETNIQDTDEVIIRRGSNNYRAQVQHLPSANPSDQFNNIKNAYYVSTNASVTDHADTAQSGSIADIITNEMSGVQGDIILPGNKTYQIKQALTIPATARLMPQKGAIIDTDVSIRDANYKWTLSGSGTSEYYLEAAAGGNPNINESDDVAENDSLMTEATVGSLSAGQWDWGNNDTLGFNTIYVRLSDSSDPDGKAADYVEAGYNLTINGQLDDVAFQIFSGCGRIIFGAASIKKPYPQLWGANPSASEAINTIAFNQAFANHRVFIPGGEYNLNALNTVNHPIEIKGVNKMTVLNFNTVSDAMKFTITTPVYPLDEGLIIENIRLDNTTNVPASFINIDTARNARLTNLSFISATATIGIVNQSCYGLELHKCRWNDFTGTALKLLENDAAPNNSPAINLFDCDFSNITGIAIEQEGGTIRVFGGVIESASSVGMVRLATNRMSSASFSGVHFEGTSSCFILAPPAVPYWPMTVSITECGVFGNNNWFDLGYKGVWNVTSLHASGGAGNVTFKATGNNDENLPRLIINQSVDENFIYDASLNGSYSVISKIEKSYATTSDGSYVDLHYANNYTTILSSLTDDGLKTLKDLGFNSFSFVGVAAESLEVDTESGSGGGAALVLCSNNLDVAIGIAKLFLLVFASNGTIIADVEVDSIALGGGTGDWNFTRDGSNILHITSTVDTAYKVGILYLK